MWCAIGLVRVVAAIVDAVTEQIATYALLVRTLELAGQAALGGLRSIGRDQVIFVGRWNAAHKFIGHIATVVVLIAHLKQKVFV